MAFQKVDFLFIGRDYWIFGGASFSGCGYRTGFLCGLFPDDRIYCHSHADLRGPGTGLAFHGLYYFPGRRDPAFLHGDFRGVSGENVSGDEASAHLSTERIQ